MDVTKILYLTANGTVVSRTYERLGHRTLATDQPLGTLEELRKEKRTEILDLIANSEDLPARKRRPRKRAVPEAAPVLAGTPDGALEDFRAELSKLDRRAVQDHLRDVPKKGPYFGACMARLREIAREAREVAA